MYYLLYLSPNLKTLLMKSLLIILSIACTSITFSQRNEMKKNGVTTRVDKMTEKKTTQLNLSTSSLKLLAESSIGVLKSSDSTVLVYSFLYQKSWLFVNKITIKIDGVLFDLESIEDRREIEPQAYISEKNWYRPSEGFLEALKNAKTIEYRLHGKSYYEDFTVKETKLSVIPEFFN